MGVASGLSSSEELLERLRKKQAEKKGIRFTKIKSFFGRNATRFQTAALSAFILSLLSLMPGVGFTATVDVTSSQLVTPGHPCYGYVCEGTMNTTFNPILYPVNQLWGNEVSTGFLALSNPYDSSGESVKERTVAGFVVSRLPMNIPFFFAFGFLLAAGLERAISSVRGRRLKTLARTNA